MDEASRALVAAAAAHLDENVDSEGILDVFDQSSAQLSALPIDGPDMYLHVSDEFRAAVWHYLRDFYCFSYPPSIGDVRLFNDTLRTVLSGDQNLPDVGECAAMVRSLLRFMLDDARPNAPLPSVADSVDDSEDDNMDASEEVAVAEVQTDTGGVTIVLGAAQRDGVTQDDTEPGISGTSGSDIVIPDWLMDAFDITISSRSRMPISSRTSNFAAAPVFDDAYEELTEGRPEYLETLYATGCTTMESREQHREDFRPFRRLREISLPDEYCDSTPNYSVDSDNPALGDSNYQRGLYYRRLCALEEYGEHFPHLTTRELFSQRQARHQAGLDTSEMDFEITQRVIQSPRDHGLLGDMMHAMGFIEEVERDGEDYQLR
ncbi:hypothetical protein N0V90_003851 [Kalmusia sp. IMI 367209]|nr:hypothetical protein N0V90_003851 [Kalmusia sp. IMI 367209]